MTLEDFDKHIHNLLPMKAYSHIDKSLNGIQVELGKGVNEKINKIAFSVDASLTTINMAYQNQANILFVHHGLFWGKMNRITGELYQRIKLLRELDVALYAVHLPLDADIQYGHNYQLAKLLSLENLQPFGYIKEGLAIGVIGNSKDFLTSEDIFLRLQSLGLQEKSHVVKWIYNKNPIKKIAIVSGAGSDTWIEAKDKGADLLITGETLHQYYHSLREANFNLLAIGHYFSERWGLIALAYKFKKHYHVPTCFLEHETYL